MRNKKNKKNNITYYARILIVVGLTFLIYGAILDLSNEKRLYNPVTDVTEKEEGTARIIESLVKQGLNIIEEQLEEIQKEKDYQKYNHSYNRYKEYRYTTKKRNRDYSS